MTDNRAWRGAATISVYGRRAVMEAIAAQRDGALSVDLVRVAETLPKQVRQEFTAAARAIEAPRETTDLQGVGALSNDPRNDQGVAARVTLKRTMDVDAFAHTLTGPRAARPARIIAADSITNSQNIGMIVRASCGAGFDAILWPKQGCPWINGLVVKASAATVLRATIVTCDGLAEGIAALQGYGFRVLGLDASAADSVWADEPAHRAAYVVGSELAGISDAVRAQLDGTVSIPMAAGVESLNAATASAVLCFAVMRERAGAPRPEIS